MRTERINLRVDAATDTLLREAAAYAGKSLTAFLLDAARDEARRVIYERHRFDAVVAATNVLPRGPAPDVPAPAARAERRTHVDV